MGRPVERGQNGKLLCRLCRVEVSGRRIYWCSDACVEHYKVLSDPGYVRGLLFKRDHGVCRLCGLDTVELEERHRVANETSLTYLYWFEGRALPRVVRSLWDADHTVPVVEGGGLCGIDGYRTLCIWCHKAETKALAGRLAEKRRAQMRTDPGVE